MFQESFKDVSRGVLRVFQGGSVKGIIGLLMKFRTVLRKFQYCFKEILRAFQEGSYIFLRLFLG